MLIFNVVTGFTMLTLGRQLFWFFVGGVGVILGINIATRLFPGQSDPIFYLVIIFSGVLGAVLAITLQRLAVFIAGFAAGGYITITMLGILNVDITRLSWLPFMIGGLIASLLVLAIFEWALIFLSSLLGTTLIVQSINYNRTIMIFLYFFLLLVGITVQAITFQREQ